MSRRTARLRGLAALTLLLGLALQARAQPALRPSTRAGSRSAREVDLSGLARVRGAPGDPRLRPTIGEVDARQNPVEVGAAPFRRVIRSIQPYQGGLWFGTYGAGLFRLGDDGDVRRFQAASSGLTEDRVNVLAVLAGRLWVGTCAGIDVVEGQTFVQHHRARPGGLSGDIYHCLTRLEHATGLWAGTTGQGLSVWRGGAWTPVGRAQGLWDLWINAVADSPDGRLWVATGQGLFSGTPDQLRYHRAQGQGPPGSAEVTALAWQGSMLWVGTAKFGLFGLRGDLWYPVPASALPSQQVHALLTDREGRLWIGTRRGLARYSLRAGFHRVALPPEDHEVKVLAAGPEGQVWAGTFSGALLEARPGADPEVRFRVPREP